MTKVRYPTYAMREVKYFDAVAEFVTSARSDRGIKTICDSCGKPISDEFFYGGFKSGEKNRIFHWDCLDERAHEMSRHVNCGICKERIRLGEGEWMRGDYIHKGCHRS